MKGELKMKLILPDYDFKFEDGNAEVKNGNLFIYRAGAFAKIMTKLTYLVYGNDECFFCHRKKRPNALETDNTKYFSRITKDHLIPQEFGGPTITNNLRPACSECNNEKENMYLDEFEEYRRIKYAKDGNNEEKLRKFKEDLRVKQEKRKRGEIESIPKEYLSDEIFNNIYVNFWIDQPLGEKYMKQEDFLKDYGRLPKPIIISQNKFLLDGFNSILLAKYNLNEKLSIIVLENVFFKGFPD